MKKDYAPGCISLVEHRCVAHLYNLFFVRHCEGFGQVLCLEKAVAIFS